MLVRATAMGHDGQQIRQPGEVFDMPDKIKGSWFVPVDAKKERKSAADQPAEGGELV